MFITTNECTKYTTKTAIIDNIQFDSHSPDNIRLYHGTTHFGRTIPQFGFEIPNKTIWHCSDETKVYFYDFEAFAKVEGDENEDFDFIQDKIIHRANEMGQIQEAVLENPGNKTYVLEIILPREAKDFIFPDTSCENMINYGAVEMDINIINYFIEKHKCTINLYRCDFLPKCSYLYIIGLINNPYAELYFNDLPPFELKLIKSLSQIDFYPEELYDDCFDGLENWFGPMFDDKCKRE